VGCAAGDVGVQMADGLLLLGDDAVDEVADGDDADDGAVFGDGKMAEVTVGDDAEALADGVLAGVSLDDLPWSTTLRA
jgi:hypothetical protein